MWGWFEGSLGINSYIFQVRWRSASLDPFICPGAGMEDWALLGEHKKGEKSRNVKSLWQGGSEYGRWGRGGHAKGENWRERVKSVIQDPKGVGGNFEVGGTGINDKDEEEVVFSEDSAWQRCLGGSPINGSDKVLSDWDDEVRWHTKSCKQVSDKMETRTQLSHSPWKFFLTPKLVLIFWPIEPE